MQSCEGKFFSSHKKGANPVQYRVCGKVQKGPAAWCGFTPSLPSSGMKRKREGSSPGKYA